MKNDANIRNFIEISGNMHGKSRNMHGNRGFSRNPFPDAEEPKIVFAVICGRFWPFPVVFSVIPGYDSEKFPF